MLKAVIIDFDKTITTQDMSDLQAGLAGKEAESAELNRQFQAGEIDGLTGLVQRINFLEGHTVSELRELVANNNYVRTGAAELFEFFRAHHIISIIASGSTVPFLEIYQPRLRADYLVGSEPEMHGETFGRITVESYGGLDFKVRRARAILDRLHISAAEVAAIGDSLADQGIFAFAATSIAIDPQPEVAGLVDHVIHDDLNLAIPILEALL